MVQGGIATQNYTLYPNGLYKGPRNSITAISVEDTNIIYSNAITSKKSSRQGYGGCTDPIYTYLYDGVVIDMLDESEDFVYRVLRGEK